MKFTPFRSNTSSAKIAFWGRAGAGANRQCSYFFITFAYITNKQIMKIRQLLMLIVLLLGSWYAAQGQGAAAQSYVNSNKQLALELAKRYGIPANVILAVAVVESSAGNGRAVRLLNNHFGIVGKNTLKARKQGQSRYKEYANIQESYEDFCRLIARKNFYPSIKGNQQADLWIQKISQSGYSELPQEWKRRVTRSLNNL
jgi:hypothetical protein